jgi:hypothetical protein
MTGEVRVVVGIKRLLPASAGVVFRLLSFISAGWRTLHGAHVSLCKALIARRYPGLSCVWKHPADMAAMEQLAAQHHRRGIVLHCCPCHAVGVLASTPAERKCMRCTRSTGRGFDVGGLHT